MTRYAFLAAAALTAAGIGGAAAQPRPSQKADLDAVVTKLAAGIQERLQVNGQGAVSIGEFTGPNKLNMNISARLRADLEKKLKGTKVAVRDDAKLEVRGRYALVEDPDQAGLHALNLKVQFIETDTNTEMSGLSLEALVKDNVDLAKMTGGTVSVPVNYNGQQFNDAIAESVKQPKVAVDTTKVRAKSDSPYAVELLLTPDAKLPGKPQPAQTLGGRAFVEIPRDAYYQVRLHNASPYDAAATVTIDGLDLFAFSEDKARYKNVIVPAGKSSTVKGWHRTVGRDGRGQVYSFLVTALGQGAAAQRKVSGSTGVVTVTFAAAWQEGNPPEDERDKARGVGGNATALGPPIDATMKPVERTTGVVRDVVTVRYSR